MKEDLILSEIISNVSISKFFGSFLLSIALKGIC